MSLINIFQCLGRSSAAGPRHKCIKRCTLGALAIALLCCPFIDGSYYCLLWTRAGQWQTNTLPDGSVVRLGPRTWLFATLDGSERHIRLFKGEALFSVGKEPNRPFFVLTSVALTKAVGTRFAVSRLPEGTKVTVAEGIVSVSYASRGNRGFMESVTVYAGEQVIVDERSPLFKERIDVDRELAWTMKRLDFANTPIRKAIGEFNRRNVRQIAMPNDHALLSTGVIGQFDADDPDDFERYLESMLNMLKTRESASPQEIQ